MLKRNNSDNNKLDSMTESEISEFRVAVQEELAVKDANIAAVQVMGKRLKDEAIWAAGIVQRLRAAREAAGVSLTELESRTGILKSGLSRLENSKAPNPTLATLYRYAKAIGCDLTLSIEQNG